MLKHFRAPMLLLLSLAIAGCAGTSAPHPGGALKPPANNGGRFRKRNEGYSLLYNLMKDDSDVGKIFIFKHASDMVGDLIRSVGHACQDTKKQMDQFQKSDRHIEFDVADLPNLEKRGRDIESKAVEHALLHSSGKEFELQIVYSQAKATRYAIDLCKALEEVEDNQDRKKFLEDTAHRFQDLNDKLMQLLEVKGG